MPYLGNTPPENFVNVVKQDITGDGGQNYSLNHAVSSAADLEVFVNNVQQEPTTAYTVSGSTLTFDEAVSATDDIYVIFRARSIGTATTSDQPLSATTGTFTGDLTVDTDTLVVDAANNRVGIGQSTPDAELHIGDGSGSSDNTRLRITGGTSGLSTIQLGDTASANIGQLQYDHSSNFLAVRVNGAERMRIDASGRVTMPYQPHFCAVGPASNNTYNTSPVTNYLTSMKYNTGGHYHTSGANAGKFIAPVTGTYLFYFGAFHNSAATGRVSLVVNTNLVTNPYISGHSSGMGSGYSASTAVALQNLAAGDAVQWGVSGGYIYAYGGHTAFGGYLLG